MSEDEREKKIDEERENMFYALSPYGSLDVRRAIEIALEVDEGGDWVAEQIEEYCESTGEQQKDVDVVYIVYSAIFEACRSEIEEQTGIDISGDLHNYISIYGNYLCTDFDGTEQAFKETLEVIRKIPEELRSKKLIWFMSEMEDKAGA